jgi:dGTPase
MRLCSEEEGACEAYGPVGYGFLMMKEEGADGQLSGDHGVGSLGRQTLGDPSYGSGKEGRREADRGAKDDNRGEEANNNDDRTNCSEQDEKITPLYSFRDTDRASNEKSPLDSWRQETQRDFARVIHSPCFRRLQGKTQLFPGHESDFFRNRLTHSLEVAQIAESIAMRINHEEPYFQKHPIDTKLCAVAGLVHDLGHPPFGHNGEHALDDKMKQYGGFEGNAQTLRILSKLEKKVIYSSEGGSDRDYDRRAGLNLTFRTLASALKYDRKIPHVRDQEETLKKGYYAEEAEVVKKIKTHVLPLDYTLIGPFKTIECSIMDIADDIAYSTYDLEDSLKAGFLTPADILSSNKDLLDRVASKVRDKLSLPDFGAESVIEVFYGIFSEFAKDEGILRAGGGKPTPEGRLYAIVRAFSRSKEIAQSGYLRTKFTSELVGEFVNSIQVTLNNHVPALSKIYVDPEALKKIETMKHYTYEAMIFSTRLKVAEFRGYEVVASIFDALSSSKGYLLMPEDIRELYRSVESNATARMRVICDFIAGMTDRFAIEFYDRLHSNSAQTIFKPI